MNTKNILRYRTLKDSTLKLYERKGRKIAEFLEVSNLVPKIIKKRENDLVAFFDTQGSHEKKLLLNICLLVLSPQKFNPKKGYKKLYNRLNKNLWNTHDKYLLERYSGVKNTKERNNWCEWEEVEIRLEELKNNYELTKDKKELKKYLALALYVLHPPRRLEYSQMKVIKQSAYKKLKIALRRDGVYLVIKKDGYYFSFGRDMVKVKKRFDVAHIVEVDALLAEIISLWLKENKTEYLFPIRNGEKAMDINQFSKLLKKTFEPKKISSNMLRKIFLSEWNSVQRTMIEREDMALLMNHSALVALGIYTKI